MLSIGVLLCGIGLVLLFFNTVTLSFIKDQEKDKKQIIAGILCVLVSIPMIYYSIQNIINA